MADYNAALDMLAMHDAISKIHASNRSATQHAQLRRLKKEISLIDPRLWQTIRQMTPLAKSTASFDSDAIDQQVSRYTRAQRLARYERLSKLSKLSDALSYELELLADMAKPLPAMMELRQMTLRYPTTCFKCDQQVPGDTDLYVCDRIHMCMACGE